ncbi:MAG: hypothetical protein JNL25_16170 [Rhodospirillaceae bacterium]|nr:hypothetical protein [Rhodospirillaceae bacterium]
MNKPLFQHLKQPVLALLLASFLLPALGVSRLRAETPLDSVPSIETMPDLAPDAVAVTDPEAIKRALDDLTIYGRYYDGENWIEYHLKDGRTAYFTNGCTYPGTWWMENGGICYAYPNYRDNAPNCFVMFMRPNGSIQFVAFAADGSPYLASSSVKTALGNDAHLPVGGLSSCVGV